MWLIEAAYKVSYPIYYISVDHVPKPFKCPRTGSVFTHGRLQEIRAAAIVPVVRFAPIAARATPPQGYDPSSIGSHSVRASGAMALKLNGVDDTLIQKLGRWRTDTFRRYISPQLANLTAGLAKLMTTHLTIHSTASTAPYPT
jgi:hypothetical protein